ncbi:transglutaminase family protein [Polymorphobacter sp.]|uniref:transglutaminase family protein n=1 Tax=Polymorphobacter sp. TaxID=1909290 RepID=UPI003F7233C1
MRIRVEYTTVYDYTTLASDVVQLLRVEPRETASQHVVHWRLDTDTDGHLRRGEDVFGNVTHMFYADTPIARLTLHVSGEVDTDEVHGLVEGGPERLPLPVFLRTTPLSTGDPAIFDFARDCARENPLDSCHALNTALYSQMRFDADVTHSHTDAIHAFRLQAGVCQDYSHIFLAAARHLGIPARYVSGHLVRADGLITQPAGHAWAEAHIDGLGWVGFDPTNGISVTEAHVRVAVGLDYLDAAPVRGARRGGGAETLEVTVTTRDKDAVQSMALQAADTSEAARAQSQS